MLYLKYKIIPSNKMTNNGFHFKYIKAKGCQTIISDRCFLYVSFSKAKLNSQRIMYKQFLKTMF